MGEKQNPPFQLSFEPSLKVDFEGPRVTSDSGLLLVRELDERLGLSAPIAENIMDGRRGKKMQLPLPDLLRQSIYSRLAGYEDLNDAERLSHGKIERWHESLNSECIRRGTPLSLDDALRRVEG
ncbi:MAG: transposase [Candidatus Sulfotelmatobacter sp.]